MALVSSLIEMLGGPTIGNIFSELLLFLGPLWVAVLAGIVLGWAWKPKWANLGREKLDYTWAKASSFSPDSISPSNWSFGSVPGLNSMKVQMPSCISWISDNGPKKENISVPPTATSLSSSSHIEEESPLAVTGEDLEHLSRLVEVTDGGPAWIQMMDRSTQNMNYQAWRRDPETGPPQYRSRTIFEDATPETVRDFFWDDDFRQTAKWDDMLIHFKILEECPKTGTMIVQWVRKFPFFCSDREYIIGRRIWESGRAYYCVTKGVPCTYMPRQNKPRRVDLYYSSWCIRAAESTRGTGQMTACEVLLFHHEDMGIPWEIAKLGIRQGMWGAVKKIEPGLRAYQKARLSGEPISKSAYMAQINTKVNPNYLKSMETEGKEALEVEITKSSEEKANGRNIPKLLLVGGAVALACSLDKGLLTKAVIFGVARRFGRMGRRL